MKEFTEFVAAQDPSVYIDNFQWSTCAVGKYLGSKGIIVANGTNSLVQLVPEEHMQYVASFVKELEIRLYDELNKGSFDTFGDLLKYMKELG